MPLHSEIQICQTGRVSKSHLDEFAVAERRRRLLVLRLVECVPRVQVRLRTDLLEVLQLLPELLVMIRGRGRDRGRPLPLLFSLGLGLGFGTLEGFQSGLHGGGELRGFAPHRLLLQKAEKEEER